MLEFVDGVVEGTKLLCKRAPELLRVVYGSFGEINCLDQLDDEPKPSETIWVYQRINEPTKLHMKFSKKSMSGYYMMAKYKQHESQPGNSVRSTKAWREWALNEQEKINARSTGQD